jgi:formyltetrahydrofolate synthetase
LNENVPLVAEGCANMCHHIRNANKFGVPVVVAINRFSTDSPDEIACIREAALGAGAFDAVMANHWAEGGAGAKDLGTVELGHESHTSGLAHYLRYFHCQIHLCVDSSGRRARSRGRQARVRGAQGGGL